MIIQILTCLSLYANIGVCATQHKCICHKLLNDKLSQYTNIFIDNHGHIFCFIYIWAHISPFSKASEVNCTIFITGP